MAALAVPPYDVIVWMVVFGLSAIVSFAVACCCCRRPAGFKAPGGLYHVLRGLRILIVTFVAGFLAMLVVMGILAAAGVESFLLVPTSNATCSTTVLCPTHTQDGIAGWTDQNCCSYVQGAATYNRRDVWLRTNKSRLLVHGWLLFNETQAAPSQARLNVLYNHGSGGNIAMGYRHVRYEELLSRGNVAVFTYDYPGYGRSDAESVTPAAANVMEGASAAAAWFATTWIPLAAANASSPSAFGTEAAPIDVPAVPAGGVDMSDVVLQGRSLGGWVATWLGANVADWRVRGLVLQSTLASFGELWEAYFPVGGWVLHAHVLGAQPELNSPRFIAGIGGCLYQYHSRDDEWAPFEHGRQTYDAATQKVAACSEFVAVSGATHTQPLLPRGTETLRAWLDAVRTQAPATRGSATPEAKTSGEVVAGPLAGTLVAVVVACVLSVVIGMIMERLLVEEDDEQPADGGDAVADRPAAEAP